MEKTYSQKVARVFEIVDYFLLLPAAVGALVGIAMLVGNPFYGLVWCGFLGVGIALMVGYFKHSRGRLDEKHLSLLWTATAVYNFILLLPWLYWASSLLHSRTAGDGQILGFLAIVPVVAGYLAAVILALKANSFEKRKKYL